MILGLNLFELEDLIDRSLREDVGTGDLTTNCIRLMPPLRYKHFICSTHFSFAKLPVPYSTVVNIT